MIPDKLTAVHYSTCLPPQESQGEECKSVSTLVLSWLFIIFDCSQDNTQIGAAYLIVPTLSLLWITALLSI